MRRLPLAPYQVTIETAAGPEEHDFDIRGSLGQMLFNPALQLTADEAFEAKDLLDRIGAADGEVLLDKSDMARLMRAYQAVRAPHPNALELLRRIRDAEEIEVGPKEVR